MTDDASDLTAATAGDHQAFARLYDRHAGVVLSLCRHRTRCTADAEDALQETFIRAYNMLRQLDGPDGFRPWLYAIAKHVCAERRRAAKRRTRHEEQAVIRRIEQDSPVTSPPACVSQTEQLALLEAALDTLPDKERLAIHLFYLDADPVTAAASALGLSRGGFYKLLNRARIRLATLMREVPTR